MSKHCTSHVSESLLILIQLYQRKCAQKYQQPDAAAPIKKERKGLKEFRKRGKGGGDEGEEGKRESISHQRLWA